MRKYASFLALGGALLVASSAVHAAQLNPGSSTTPDSGMPSATTNGTVGGYAAQSFNKDGVQGTIYVTAVKEAGGSYDFLYQVKLNSGSAALSSFSASGFSTFTTNVSQASSVGSNLSTQIQNQGFAAPPTGTVQVATDSRTVDAPGNPSAATFTFGTGGLTAGNTSYAQIVQTSANDIAGLGNLTFKTSSGTFSIGNPFAPSMAPEPSTIVLFGGVFAAFAGGMMWRRRKNAPALSPIA